MIGNILTPVPDAILNLFKAPKPYTSKNPDYLELIKDKMSRQQLMKHLKIDLIKAEQGYAECFGHFDTHKEQQDGILHGGMTSVMSDIVQGFAAFSLCSKEDRVVTSQLSISYFKPGIGDAILSRGWVEKPGSRLMYCEAEVYMLKNNVPTLIAKSTAIMAVIEGKNAQ